MGWNPKKRKEKKMDNQKPEIPIQIDPESTSPGKELIFSGELNLNELMSKCLDIQNVEALERLTALYEKQLARVSEAAYNEDMRNFQNECPVIIKTKSVTTNSGTLAYRYAPLDEIKKQTKELIFHYGFSYHVNTTIRDGQIEVVLTVSHKEGHKKEFRMCGPDMPQNKMANALQARAGAITFMTRYLYCGAFGIVTADEDTDGRTFFEDASGTITQDGSSEKTVSFQSAPDDCKPIYQAIMALLNLREGKENIFSVEDRREIKKTADSILGDKNAIEDYYKAVKSRANAKQEQLRNAD